ncbi:hypothetical protein [Iodobacter ciconiae]|uniref:HTH OST-type domain-containing protein n=1 Tax=Iodobacter ciconiae TaxID=2496266 RepID=A0A3S8ZPZ5_9NEIS|nr:hypothetical protein [Iodobacter ciconiae]AZN35546.1 hypothetical protein EJO50_03010 [Iodobacter ciconiae]
MNTAYSNEELKSFIEDLVKKEWESKKNGILLSKLGDEVKKNFSLNKSEDKFKLSEFINNEMNKCVKIIISPKNKIIRVVVPVGMDEELDGVNVFPGKNEKKIKCDLRSSANENGKVLEFNYLRNLVKIAFEMDLPEGKKRILNVANKVSYRNVGHDYENKESERDIDAKLINKTDSDEELLSKVLEWANSNNVDPNLLFVRPDLPPYKENIRSKNNINNNESLMHEIISALSEEQLSRVVLPLDVIKKLMGR